MLFKKNKFFGGVNDDGTLKGNKTQGSFGWYRLTFIKSGSESPDVQSCQGIDRDQRTLRRFGAGPEDQDANLVDKSENDSDATSDGYEPEPAEAVQDHDEQTQEETHEVSEAPAAEPFVLEAVVNHSEPEIDAPFVEVAEEDIPDHEAEAAFFADQSESLTSKIAALEAVIGKTDDQWEPDDTGSSDYSGTEAPSMKWDDVGFDSDAHNAEGANAETVEVDVEPQQAAFAQSADELLDEDALRDIVSEIVREELQGALGERITRNVSKLVRREIHRALAAQELE